MKNRIIQWAMTLSCFMMFIATAASVCAFENLDEMMTRKARRGTNTYYHGAMSANNFVRQPETLCYSDIQTGGEVWILSNTANMINSYHGEISPANPWSADGKYLGYFSGKAPVGYNWTSRDSFGGGTVAYIMRTNGSYLREAVDASFRSHTNSVFRFFNWNMGKPNTYYSFGETSNGRGLALNDLYENVVSDTSITFSKLITLPSGKLYNIYKTINPTGSHLLIQDSTKTMYFPVQLLPTPLLLIPNGWSYDRGQASDYGGGYDNQHDLAFPDPKGKFFVHLTSSYPAFWKMNLHGTHNDGGPTYTTGSPLSIWDEQEVEPMWTKSTTRPVFQPNANWWGHPGFDRWGRMVSSGQGNLVGGRSDGSDAVWDYTTRKYVYGNSTVGYAAHPYTRSYTDWSAWSDYISGSNDDGLNQYLYVFNYSKRDTDGDHWLVANHHGNQNQSTSYEATSYARQCQSPDGTKVAFDVSFLNSIPNKLDIAYAVSYYPYPPEIIQASAQNNRIAIRFDWRLDQPKPRGYTRRSWPTESQGPPPPREIGRFRLWRSPDGSNWTPLTTVEHNIFARFDFVNGGYNNSQSSFWEILDSAIDGTWYYGVTSIEHSGLESRQISNTWKVQIADGLIINCQGNGEQASPYPPNPGAKEPFFKTKPPAPQNLTVTKLNVPGQYRLEWQEPQYPLVRYYNIYYSNLSIPPLTQHSRIASIPAGISSYVDWLADTNLAGYYRITTVDMFGNEGTDSGVGPPSGLKILN